jgi:hypothetical protein
MLTKTNAIIKLKIDCKIENRLNNNCQELPAKYNYKLLSNKNPTPIYVAVNYSSRTLVTSTSVYLESSVVIRATPKPVARSARFVAGAAMST